MGLKCSSLTRKFRKKNEVRILMLGLDGAGKTTILYKLKLGEVLCTIPTIGFNVETLKYGHLTFIVWDVGGQKRLREFWHHYYKDTKGLIFVVDSSDRQRIPDVNEELEKILAADEMKDAVLLVLANKQDMPNALNASELTEKLKLDSLIERSWHVQHTCAVKDEGLNEGMNWLRKELTRRYTS